MGIVIVYKVSMLDCMLKSHTYLVTKKILEECMA